MLWKKIKAEQYYEEDKLLTTLKSKIIKYIKKENIKNGGLNINIYKINNKYYATIILAEDEYIGVKNEKKNTINN